jgi:CelD/BcsL family acetyltransferase involved in cellulose biosynthesis
VTAAELLELDQLGEPELAAWRRLADRALEPNPYFDPDFVLPTAAALEAEVSLLVAAEGGEWSACLPVMRQRGWRGVPAVGLVAWRNQYCFLGSPLVAPGSPAASLEQLLARGLEEAPGFLGLDLLVADGPAWEALSMAIGAVGARPVELRRFERAFLDAADERKTNLSRKHERNMTRLLKRLGDELGAPLSVDDRAGDEAAYDDFLRLESAGWKGEGGTALASSGHSELFREISRGFAARGELQLLDLNSAGRTVAMICVLTAGDTGFTFKIAIDEEWRRFGPGTQIMLAQIEGLGESRVRRLDSCAEPGHEMAERAWAGRRELAIMALPSPGLRGVAIRPLLRGAPAARRLLRR